MDTNQAEFVQMIRWITNQKDIPLQTRRDFVSHLREVGYMDEKSRLFVENYIQKRTQKALKGEKQAEKSDQILTNLIELEKNPETSLKVRVTNNGITEIESLSSRFTSNFKTRESELASMAESSESQFEKAQIDAIKANL